VTVEDLRSVGELACGGGGDFPSVRVSNHRPALQPDSAAKSTAATVNAPAGPEARRLFAYLICKIPGADVPLDRPMRLTQCPRRGHYGQTGIGLQLLRHTTASNLLTTVTFLPCVQCTN
jgi:hypothetical protein